MKHLLYLLVALVMFSCGNKSSKVVYEQDVLPQKEEKPKPKNIILLIGDGMGVSQITAGMIANGNRLNLERMPVVGFHKSQASDKLITDSAAGATAFSCGEKTYNGALAIKPDSTVLETIMETAHKAGLATGLIATASITHATPAAFYAHQTKRKRMEANALDLVKGDAVDMFVGGGGNYFLNRSDSLNLADSLPNHYRATDLEAFKMNTQPRAYYFPYEKEPPALYEGRNDYFKQLTPVMAQKLAVNEKGFFMMAEGSQIDWGGHANNADYIIGEMLEFDATLGAVLDFAEQDGNTLVIVTADHETGGFAINGGKLDGTDMEYGFTTPHHTPDLIPVFAYGPGSDVFGGIYDNTSIYFKMMDALGLHQ